jgi:hypothetical protein
VVEWLPSKPEAPSSDPSTAKTKQNRKKNPKTNKQEKEFPDLLRVTVQSLILTTGVELSF